MPNPLTLADAADAVDRSIQNYWVKGTDPSKQIFRKYVNVTPGVTDYYTKESGLSGLGIASRTIDNASIVAESPVQLNSQTYTQMDYGKIMSFSKMMWMFGIKKRNVERISNALRSACEELVEQRCADRLDNAFSSSYEAQDDGGNYSVTINGGDGVSFINSSHPREDAGTAWNNTCYDGTTYNQDIDIDAIEAAHRTASLIKNPKGRPMNINLDTLITKLNTAQYFRAKVIANTVAKGMNPSTADREAAGISTFNVIGVPWITTNTAYWYMFDSSMVNAEYGLQYFEAQPIQKEGPFVVVKTGEIQFKSSIVFDIGHNDSRGWIGSKNTNAA